MRVQTLQLYSKISCNNQTLPSLFNFFSLKCFSALKMEHINVEIKEIKLNCSCMFHFQVENVLEKKFYLRGGVLDNFKHLF